MMSLLLFDANLMSSHQILSKQALTMDWEQGTCIRPS